MISDPSPSPAKRPAPRGAEIATGVLVLLFALGITTFIGMGSYRMVSEAYQYRIKPPVSVLVVLSVFILIAIPLWVFAIRLLRGRGHRGSDNLFSPRALVVSGWFFLLFVLDVVWLSILADAYIYMLAALPALLCAVIAFRRARTLNRAAAAGNGSLG